MSVTMVNGYACFSCAETARARRGENPRLTPEQIETRRTDAERVATPVVGGPGAATDGNAGRSDGRTGSRIDVWA